MSKQLGISLFSNSLIHTKHLVERCYFFPSNGQLKLRASQFHTLINDIFYGTIYVGLAPYTLVKRQWGCLKFAIYLKYWRYFLTKTNRLAEIIFRQ
jgi:hypothetical protein